MRHPPPAPGEEYVPEVRAQPVRPALPSARSRAEIIRTGVGVANLAVVVVLLLRSFGVF